MTQELANSLKEEFKKITKIDCNAVFMEKGENHIPTRLENSEMGVYVFLLNEKICFKVGKAGANSQARWNSHHYNIDNSTPSTFTKSILANLDFFKNFFDSNLHDEIDKVFKKKKKPKEWI